MKEECWTCGFFSFGVPFCKAVGEKPCEPYKTHATNHLEEKDKR